jgi:hypothetical protein
VAEPRALISVTGIRFATDMARRLRMSQNDQNRDRQNQRDSNQDPSRDHLRESRPGSSRQDRDQQNQRDNTRRPDQSSDLEDIDEMDEDRDDDERVNGGSNRRRNMS